MRTIRNSRNNDGVISSYWNCKHEGSFQSEAKEVMVGLSKKLSGSKLCPAFLKKKTVTATGTIEVVAYFEHYDHEKLPGHRAFNKDIIGISLFVEPDQISSSH